MANEFKDKYQRGGDAMRQASKISPSTNKRREQRNLKDAAEARRMGVSEHIIREYLDGYEPI